MYMNKKSRNRAWFLTYKDTERKGFADSLHSILKCASYRGVIPKYMQLNLIFEIPRFSIPSLEHYRA